MRLAYRKLPDYWDIYWHLRVGSMCSVRDARQSMIDSGYTNYQDETLFTLRQSEIYTRYTVWCECTQCHFGTTEHFDNPIEILPPTHYNERDPLARYGKG